MLVFQPYLYYCYVIDCKGLTYLKLKCYLSRKYLSTHLPPIRFTGVLGTHLLPMHISACPVTDCGNYVSKDAVPSRGSVYDKSRSPILFYYLIWSWETLLDMSGDNIPQCNSIG